MAYLWVIEGKFVYPDIPFFLKKFLCFGEYRVSRLLTLLYLQIKGHHRPKSLYTQITGRPRRCFSWYCAVPRLRLLGIHYSQTHVFFILYSIGSFSSSLFLYQNSCGILKQKSGSTSVVTARIIVFRLNKNVLFLHLECIFTEMYVNCSL